MTIQSIGGGGGFALIDARSKDGTQIGADDSQSNSASGSINLTNNADITLNRSSNALTVQTISSGGGVINPVVIWHLDQKILQETTTLDQ